MTDHLTPEKRSWNMAQIKDRDTKPEMIVRSMLHRMGYRFRIHRKNMPGKPDIVLPKYKTVLFVHGCFWHRHRDCKFATTPKSNESFWKEKFDRNVANDRKHQQSLKQMGWQVIVVWECELTDMEQLIKKIEAIRC